MSLPRLPMPSTHRQRVLATVVVLATLLVILLAGTWWAYHPGLSGGFQFDDFANLPALGATGPVNDWPTFWRYITSGHADPTGRPIAMLSFLIDANNWPASPRPFLVTSVILHLINGVLLFALLRLLGRAFVVGAHRMRDGLKAPSRSAPSRMRCAPTGRDTLIWRVDLAALLGAAFWLLHPLLVSTTLYIVQREAMLPATFVLLGLMAWLRGRGRMLAGHTLAGVVWMLVGLGLCTVLAFLSKANGALLPALALTIEYTVLRHRVGRTEQPSRLVIPAKAGIHFRARRKQPMDPGLRRDDAACGLDASTVAPSGAPTGASNKIGAAARGSAWRRYRWALAILAWVPAILIALYLLHRGWDGFAHGTGRRPWTMGQRLLTEPRVLMDYLQLLWIPRPFTPGLFNDQIHASLSLLQPWTTLPCLLAVVGLIIGALVMRKRWPAWALAVLFFFVGQTIESSTVSLELFFEHRNYLPTLLMFWALALWLCGLRQRTHPPRPRKPRTGKGKGKPSPPWVIASTKAVLAIAILVSLGVMTHARTSVWGNVHEQALLWAKLNPDSPRAQANAALAQMHAGKYRSAAQHLRGLLQHDPSQLQLALNLFGAECGMGHVSAKTMQASRTALATTRDPGALLSHWFGRAIGETAHPPCPQLTLATVKQLLAAAKSNPKLMKVKGRRQDIAYAEGLISLKRKKPNAALAYFEHSLDQDVRISGALKMAAELGSHGYPTQGLAMLRHYQAEAPAHQPHPGLGMRRIHQWVLHKENYWQGQLVYLRKTLQGDAAAKASRTPASAAPTAGRWLYHLSAVTNALQQ